MGIAVSSSRRKTYGLSPAASADTPLEFARSSHRQAIPLQASMRRAAPGLVKRSAPFSRRRENPEKRV